MGAKDAMGRGSNGIPLRPWRPLREAKVTATDRSNPDQQSLTNWRNLVVAANLRDRART